MIGDLHCHTRFSDGSLGVDELIFYAKRAGLDFVALTDHDTMAGVNRAEQLGKRHGIGVISGVEMSCWDEKTGRKVHLLCYLPKYPNRLEGQLKRTLESRDQAVRRSLQKVMRYYPITEEHVLQFAKGSACLYGVHIMCALIDLGYTDSLYGQLFQELLGPNGSCYESHAYGDVWETAKLIRSAGGVCVLAHPSVYDSIDLMWDLAKAGLIDGVERFHPRVNPQDAAQIEQAAQEYGLLQTGGTDFHGGYTNHPNPLGSCLTTGDAIEQIFKLAKSR